MQYNKCEAKNVEYFQSVVGTRFVSDNPAICASYLSKSVMGLESQIGDVIIRPRYTEEVRKILIWCSERRIPVSPVSAGLSGDYGERSNTSLLSTNRIFRTSSVYLGRNHITNL